MKLMLFWIKATDSQWKQQSQTGQGQMEKKEMVKSQVTGIQEIHKLIEEARTCLWDTFSMDYHQEMYHLRNVKL